jgi:plastocyanin
MRAIRTALVVIALASLVTIVGCSSSTTTTPSTPASGTGTSTSAVAVSLKNFAFDPAQINVAVGGTVTFTNNDSTEHIIAGDGWTSGAMAAGATFSHTFPTAGTFPIRCTIHSSMTASVIVK